MRTHNDYRSWAHACVAMEPSLGYRPEDTHKDGYEGRIPTTWAGIEAVRVRAALELRWSGRHHD